MGTLKGKIKGCARERKDKCSTHCENDDYQSFTLSWLFFFGHARSVLLFITGLEVGGRKVGLIVKEGRNQQLDG